jgi:Mg2+ and Co2+ transporter CorA
VLAAIFFPLTALSGIFGMNLHTGLEGASTWLLGVVLLPGILLGFGLSWRVLGTVRDQK